MPNNTDLRKVLIIGGGPVMIGQGCELDMLACQAIRLLREHGIETVLVDCDSTARSADPGVADTTYIEPLRPDSIIKIIEKEQPDAVLAAFGGQTALNLTSALARDGELSRLGIRVIGADPEAIARVEDRRAFKQTMEERGLPILPSEVAESIEEGLKAVRRIGFPAIIRSAYTTGGAGSSVAYNVEEFVPMIAAALKSSPICQVMVEKAVLGWKEAELEVLRDSHANAVVLACAESIEPAGVHTGDSTVVIPPQSLSAEQVDSLRRIALAAVDAIGVVGVAGVRFALHPPSSVPSSQEEMKGGEIALMGASVCTGPLTSLTSHITGAPLGRVAAGLAIGLTLDEMLPPDATEPREFVAVKVPRFAFERFPGADETLGTSMKSVGEVVGIGCCFAEALQKAVRALEIGRAGLGADGRDEPRDPDTLRSMLAKPNPNRLFDVRQALLSGMSASEIAELTRMDPAIIGVVGELVEFEQGLEGRSLVSLHSEELERAKALGYSDAQLAFLLETDEQQVRIRRKVLGIKPESVPIRENAYFFSYGPAAQGCFGKHHTPKHESAIGDASANKASRSTPADGRSILVLGGGPNRIGQSAEFAYCRAHALRALAEQGFAGIAIDANSAGVTTDPGTPSIHFIEPQTAEAVLDAIDREKPDGAIVQFAGRTMLSLARAISSAGVPILGTSIEAIERVKNPARFADLVNKLGVPRAPSSFAVSADEALAAAERVGYPLLARAARRAGGQAAEIIYDAADFEAFVESGIEISSDRSLLVDRFIEGAIEVGVDVISDGETTLVCGVMEFIEQAGVHSGDSACSLPPYSLPDEIVEQIKDQACRIADEIGIKGLMSAQFAVRSPRVGAGSRIPTGHEVFLLEVNPRASRTVPFVSKATGIDWAGAATRAMLGRSLQDQGLTATPRPDLKSGGGSGGHVSVRETVFPFARFPNVDVVLGPEMKSTGEVMGIDENFGAAYIKAQLAAGQNLPDSGTAFVSVAGADKAEAVEIGRKLVELGFEVVATKNTANALREAGVKAGIVHKIGEGRPDAIDLIKNGRIDLIINTPSGKKPRMHEVTIRSAAVARGIPIVTTIAGARATLFGMEAIRTHRAEVRALHEYT